MPGCMDRACAKEEGSTNDDGCVARVPVNDVPEVLLARARSMLPRARKLMLEWAERSRVMFNFHWRLQVHATDPGSGRVWTFQLGVCEHAWRPHDTVGRNYHPMWRALASPVERRPRRRTSRPRAAFRLDADFNYTGRFPCTLHPEPWKRPANTNNHMAL